MFTRRKGQPPPAPHTEEIGFTQEFVLARGYQILGGFEALIGVGGDKRLFAELNADRDRSDVRPGDAYLSLLSSMHPGWKFRLLQLYWPDPEPRTAFYQNVRGWRQQTVGMSILKDGLILALDQFGLPFGRRTFLEFVYADEESLTWWEALPTLCQTFGVHVSYLARDEITKLARWIFNPTLE
jgi:hypothetical protein